jgi:hypothetical protein
LARRFDDERVKIDTSVHNPSRICKLYGTFSKKGDHTQARPWRRSRIILIPEQIEAVPYELLTALAAEVPVDASPAAVSVPVVWDGGPATQKLLRRVENYMAKVPGAVSGQHGHDATIKAANILVHRFALSDDEAWPIFCAWNQSCSPPWEEHDLRRKLVEARKQPHGDYGDLRQEKQRVQRKPKAAKSSPAAPIAAAPEVEPGAHRSAELATSTPPAQDESVKTEEPEDRRAQIEISFDEHETNDEAIFALSADLEIYQRHGALVQIVRGTGPKDGLRRPENALRIVVLKASNVRDRLSRVAKFVMIDMSKEEPTFEQKHVPAWCVQAVTERGHWDDIRPLEAIVNSPVLRRDGTVASKPGYDPDTGLVFDPQGAKFEILAEPTRDDAFAAANRLLDLVMDFPFATPAHKSSWLAALLTPPARFAFDGPVPLFLFDANTRGSGKTMLTEVISLILTGRDFARMTNPKDDEECKKLITSLVRNGDQLVLIDNISGALGCAALDAALTATEWKDRLLGENKIVTGRMTMTWYASGNNVIVRGDTTRRICHCRLESVEERPEEREGFKYPHLTRHVRENREALLADVLTILSAFCLAHKQQVKLKPWGSYEGWSDLVRKAIVWLGLPDPGDTRQELVDVADREADNLRELLAGWEEIDEDCCGLTVAEAMLKLKNHPTQFKRLRGALAEIFNLTVDALPGNKSVGNKLRHLRGRICGGKTFEERPNRDKVKVWRVKTVPMAAVTPTTESRAGSAGSAGSNSPTSYAREADSHASCAHACKPEIDPADPADPAPLPDVVKHRGDCNCREWWQHLDGTFYCTVCWPCKDPKAMKLKGLLA